MKPGKLKIPKRYLKAIFFLVFFIFGVLYLEIKTSVLQSRFFSSAASDLKFSLKEGSSSRIYFPEIGPYDLRLGYVKIPQLVASLKRNSYQVSAQAEISEFQDRLIKNWGVFPIYSEKSVSGIEILDSKQQVIYQTKRPERIINSFEEIPKVMVDTLLFIENREMLDPIHPYKNPAVEWDRFTKAIFEKSLQVIYPDISAPGGSTLATQIEKYRHSREGRTKSAKDKFQQMLTASFRAYLGGRNTLEARKKIVLDYINTVPLSALAGYGEVNGLGDGLWAWYGVDPQEIFNVLNNPDSYQTPEKIKIYALAFKQVLSLFLSHRRPSSYLLVDVKILNAFTDDYLELLTEQGIISKEIRDAAQEQDLYLKTSAPNPDPISFLDRKAANAIRSKLLKQFAMSKLYELDQMDLKVTSTLNKLIQDQVTQALISLKDKKTAQEFGLVGEHSLDKGDLAKVIYSVTLYEQRNGENLLRVQTDNYDKPFNINEGSKLDLGSTAKLRVLSNYLDIVSSLFENYLGKTKEEIKTELKIARDPITQWVLEYLASTKNPTLEKILAEAMNRRYSANPGEPFFTGGGLHYFANFKKEDNAKVPTVTEAIRHSINLPFIRLMRDLVRYYMAQNPASPTRAKVQQEEAVRQAYLAKFADKEGSYFLEQFYKKYNKLNAEEILAEFLDDIKIGPKKLTAIFRYIYPEKPLIELNEFLENWLPNYELKNFSVNNLYESFAPGKYNLQDQGFIAKVHPLELWLVKYLIKNPQAKFSEVSAASGKERQEVYQWLFQTKYRHSQDVRIKVLVEMEAFLEMHRAWKKLGYPFESLVPSYATAIGSSGDRPMALAELLGIILGDGIRYPDSRIAELNFAKDTPFETILKKEAVASERVMRVEVARVLRKALTDIVENGTARRAGKVFKTEDGKFLAIGGKTGTGDNRFETFGPGGVLLTSRVVNRTATFAFFIGDQFFGVVTAHVQGEEAANYDFTSALAAGLLKALAPALSPMVASKDNV